MLQTPMLNLLASLVTLFVSHWVPSHPAIRPQLVERLGQRGFRIAYSILSLAVIGWVILAYGAAWESPYLWYPPFEMRWFAVGLMPVSIWLITVRMSEKPSETPTGVYRLIAAPGSAGFLLWSLLHLANLGQVRAILLFGAFIAGGLSQERAGRRAGIPRGRNHPARRRDHG